MTNDKRPDKTEKYTVFDSPNAVEKEKPQKSVYTSEAADAPGADTLEREPIGRSVKWLAFWVGLAAAFDVGVYFFKGLPSAVDFAGGYLIELSLSIDNVFVFLMIFSSFGVSVHAQHRVLKWGIIGAVVLRFIFVFAGVALVNKFEWILYFFGALLIFNGIKMLVKEEEHKDPHLNPFFIIVRQIFPMSMDFDGDKFITVEFGKKVLTPLLGVLVIVEGSDIIFAIDSVPAVLSVSKDLLIVYSSNIFAILGLRQLFFVIEHIQERFAYVKYGVAIILMFTGVKMLIEIFHIHVSTPVSICVIMGVLAVSIVMSIAVTKVKEKSSDN